LDYYQNHCKLLANDADKDHQLIAIHAQPDQVVLTQSQKYKNAFMESQKLVTLASEVSMTKFLECLDVLHQLVQLWENNEQAAVVRTELDAIESEENANDVEEDTNEIEEDASMAKLVEI